MTDEPDTERSVQTNWEPGAPEAPPDRRDLWRQARDLLQEGSRTVPTSAEILRLAQWLGEPASVPEAPPEAGGAAPDWSKMLGGLTLPTEVDESRYHAVWRTGVGGRQYAYRDGDRLRWVEADEARESGLTPDDILYVRK